MPRLRNTNSGAVVSVSDEKAARMGSEWESVEKPAPASAAKKTAAKKTAKPSES